jgi:hypothetical protein
MSEEHDTTETETVEKRSSMNRRSVLRALGAGTAVTGLGAGIGSAKSSFANPSSQNATTENGVIVSKEGTDLKITDVQALEAGRARSELKNAPSVPETSAIKQWFLQNDLRPSIPDAGGLEFTTSKQVVNEGTPVVVSVPYKPTGRDESSVQAGLVNHLIINGENGERVPAAAIGIYTEETDQGVQQKLVGSSYTEETNQRVQQRSVGSSAGESVVFHEETVEGGVTGSGEFSTSQSIGCATCQIIYDGLVGGTWGAVNRAACLYGCTVTGPAYLVCAGACTIILSAITTYGTFYTAPVFCSDIVNYC